MMGAAETVSRPGRRALGRLLAGGLLALAVLVAGPSPAQGTTGTSTAKPAGPPPGRELGWPLWFVGYAFIHTRRAGGLLTLGLLLNAVLPVALPLPWLG